MFKFFSIYSSFVKQQIKSLIEYKLDFAMGMIGLTIYQIGSFLLLYTVFTEIQTFGSYNFNEILLFYGYSQIVRGIDHVYNDNIWDVGVNSIRDGRFAQLLIRPINPISYIVMERFQFDGMGECVIGAIIFFYAKGRLDLAFGLEGWIVFFIFLTAGLVIYFALKLMCAAAAFWIVSSGELMLIVYEVNSFTKYPLDIYKNRALEFLLTYLLPFALVSYFPMVYYIREPSFISHTVGFGFASRYMIVAFIVAIAAIFLKLSLVIWNRGLRRYEPTGT